MIFSILSIICFSISYYLGGMSRPLFLMCIAGNSILIFMNLLILIWGGK